jgi:hypothetical protein
MNGQQLAALIIGLVIIAAATVGSLNHSRLLKRTRDDGRAIMSKGAADAFFTSTGLWITIGGAYVVGGIALLMALILHDAGE